MSQKYEYFAFISYKRENEKWAKWLQRKLESYRMPIAIRRTRPELPNKVRPIFRDQSELSGGNLKAEIERGLNSSKYLIVICSPLASKSSWVSKEILYFINQGKEEYIIPFIIGGVPNAINPEDECFPDGLRQLTGEREILGININEMGREAAFIKVIAQMFNLRFDSLWHRFEKEKQKKRIIQVICAALLILTSLALSAYITNKNILLEKANNIILLEKEKVESANRKLTIANDSIIKSKLLIDIINDSLKLKNLILEELNEKLFEEKTKLLKSNNALATRSADLVATYINSCISQGNLSDAKLFASEYKYGYLFDGKLPITKNAEFALRRLYNLKCNDSFIQTNNRENVGFTHAIEVINDTLVATDGYRLIKYNTETDKIIEQYDIEIENNGTTIKYAGVLNKDLYGLIIGDSIFAIDKLSGSISNRAKYNSSTMFRQLNDSLIVINSILGNLKIVDSRDFSTIANTPIACNKIFPQPFDLDCDSDIIKLYQVEDKTLVSRDLNTGRVLWSKTFDYPIDSEVIKLKDYQLVAVKNLKNSTIELWPIEIEDSTILASFDIRHHHVGHMFQGKKLSICYLNSDGRGAYNFNQWSFLGNDLSKPYYFDNTFVDDRHNQYFFDKAGDLIQKDKNGEEEALVNFPKGSYPAIIKIKNNVILCTAKIDDEWRFIILFYKDGELLTTFPSFLFESSESHDWLHGYEGKINYLNKGRYLTSTIPFACWNQLSNISKTGKLVSCVLFDSELIVFNTTDYSLKHKTIAEEINSILITPDESSIILTTNKGLFKYSNNLSEFQNLYTNQSKAFPINAALSNNNNKLLMAFSDGTMQLVEYPSLHKVASFSTSSVIRDIGYSPNDDYIIILSSNNEVCIYDTNKLDLICSFNNSGETISAQFDNKGDNIIVNATTYSKIIPFLPINEVLKSIVPK